MADGAELLGAFSGLWLAGRTVAPGTDDPPFGAG